MDVADIAARIGAAVAPIDGIAAIYLFGSVASGTDTASSDVDVGVLYDPVPTAAIDAGPLDLEGDLERRLDRPVHLVVLNTAPADLRIRVLRAQRLLVDRNRPATDPLRSGDAERVLRSRTDAARRIARRAGGDRDRSRARRQEARGDRDRARRSAGAWLSRTRCAPICFNAGSSNTPCRSPFKAPWTWRRTSCPNDRLGEPRTNRELFAAARASWLAPCGRCETR